MGKVNQKRTGKSLSYVSDNKKRNCAFSKRKKKVFENAQQLSELTNAKVLIFLATESGNTFECSTHFEDHQPIIEALKENLEKEELNSGDNTPLFGIGDSHVSSIENLNLLEYEPNDSKSVCSPPSQPTKKNSTKSKRSAENLVGDNQLVACFPCENLQTRTTPMKLKQPSTRETSKPQLNIPQNTSSHISPSLGLNFNMLNSWDKFKPSASSRPVSTPDELRVHDYRQVGPWVPNKVTPPPIEVCSSTSSSRPNFLNSTSNRSEQSHFGQILTPLTPTTSHDHLSVQPLERQLGVLAHHASSSDRFSKSLQRIQKAAEESNTFWSAVNSNSGFGFLTKGEYFDFKTQESRDILGEKTQEGNHGVNSSEDSFSGLFPKSKKE